MKGSLSQASNYLNINQIQISWIAWDGSDMYSAWPFVFWIPWFIAWENSQHFATLPLVCQQNDVLKNKRRNSILMMPHYPDLGSASDWLKQISHRARPIRSTTQITSMEYLCSFLRHQFVGKPVVVSQNVGCFLRLWFEASGKLFNYLYFMQVLKTMDFHGHRRYHPYTPPVDAHRGRNQPFPNGQTGGWNGRYSSVHRGLGSQRSLTRGMFHHPPEHSSVSTNKTPFYPRYPGPQPRLSWFQGRSMHYGVPRPPTNYYSEQRERNFRWPSYRAARYGPYPRLHPKHMGIASSRSTGFVWTYSDGRAEGHRYLNYLSFILFRFDFTIFIIVIIF